MATRQYIGARYVPKFYQNSVDGSTQWESNVVYEPLMYVTLTNGHMYISKKQVPATIGSPVNNIDYWLDIGSYNGFIEQLQNEIDDINNVAIPAVQADVALKQNITDNNLATTNKTVVGAINEINTSVQGMATTLAGKQDALDNNLNTTSKNVVGAINEVNTALASKQNATDNSLDTTSKNVVGAINEVNSKIENIVISESANSLVANEILVITDSFGQNPNGNVLTGFNKCLNGVNTLAQGGANFSSFATMMSGYTGDKTAIKSIILVGGTNEHDVSQIASRLAEVKTASNGYPNATVFIAFIKSNFASSSERALVNSLLTEIKKECNTNGFTFLGNFNHCFYPTFANVQSDGVHPIPTSGEKIGSAVFNKYANNENKPLINSNITATDKGLTFTLICNTDGEIGVLVTGTTTENIGAGSYQSLDFGTYYYSPSLPTTYRASTIELRNGGKLVLGWSGNEVKYYYAPENSGESSLPSGTSVTGGFVSLSAVGEKQYAVTNG